MKKPLRINWTVSLFIVLTPLLGIAGTMALILAHQFSWLTALLAFVFLWLGGLSVTAGYHRLFSHRSYQAHWIIRVLFLLFGAAAFEGSALEWSTDHRNHHLYTDTEKDPYNYTQGFWYAHMGWLITLDPNKRNFSNVKDLQADPLLRFQHRFFVPLAILMGFILPGLIAMAWGDFWGGLLIAGALRIALGQQLTFCINSFCHRFGKRTYTDRNTARDNWFTALFTFGEGYHNFHHKFPIDYRNGVHLFHFDPTKWLIRGLSYARLASNLKRVNAQRIIQYRLLMDEKRLSKKTREFCDLSTIQQKIVHPLHESILKAQARLEELEKSYKTLKASKIKAVKQRAAEYRVQLISAKHEVKFLLKMWSQLLKYPYAAAQLKLSIQ